MKDLMFSLLRPLFFRLDPERAHELTLSLLARMPVPALDQFDPILETRIGALRFPSPVGLAAGFDKDARVWRQMLGFGFGFAEVGTLTPQPQRGNPRPRVFRLVEDRAVINRLGFNNGGVADALPRIQLHPRLGINVGANKDSADRIADYVAGVQAVRGHASWITLNISSPNTPGLRGLQDEALPELLAAAAEARGADGPPLFLKVAPDLDAAQVERIAEVVLQSQVAALIVSNTTVARPAGLHSVNANEAGGLSGAPLRAPTMLMLRAFRRHLGARVPLIGAGGISSAADAYARIRAGASAVQLYTAMVYEGPSLAARIATDLVQLLRRDRFSSVAEAVGTE